MSDNSLTRSGTFSENAPPTSRDNATGETKEGDPNHRAPPAKSISKHWRKLRAAVKALAAFRSRKVKASDFERMRLCGEGGSGLVYLVRLKSTTLYFALKVQLKQDLQSKERRIRRALIEREVLVTCAHPFVCNLYTAFQDTRHLYLLMDYCAGGDLASFIRNVVRRPLTEREARFYSSEIVAALEWIHLHGFVYRDLKPENVLVHESGHIRLGDFGTAERSSARNSQSVEKVSREEVESTLCEGNVESVGDGVLEMNVSSAYLPRDATDVPSCGGTQSRTRSSDHSSREGEQCLAVAGDPGELEQVRGRLCTVSVHVDPLLENGPGLGETTSGTVDTAADDTIDGGGAAPADGARPPFPPSESRPEGFLGRDGSWGREPFSAGCLWSRPKTDNKPRRGFRSTRNMPKEESTRRRFRTMFKSQLEVTGMRRMLRLEKPAKAVSLPNEDGRLIDVKRKEQTPIEDEKFSKGRGSVKLNVLLDSQSFIGTADFMSPEMVTGKERQGAAMDWWALGVMVYEMILGRLPFNSHLVETDEGLFRSIVNADVSFPPGHYLSGAVIDFIRELLRKDPSERLGERHGIGEIKRHPFFKDVHWALIASREPPFPVRGPDTPGWLESVGRVPAEDKMASWTWKNTTDTARPQVVEEQSAVSSPSLMGRSGFSISASDIGTSQMNSEGAASTRFEEGTGSGVVGENGVRVKMFISEDSDDEEPGAARSDGGEGSDDEAREAREGDGESRRRESNTLDGYDFNTIHKVGSFVLGKGSSLTRGLGPMPSSRPQSKRSSSAPESSGGKQVRSSSSLQRAPCRGHGDIGSRDL